MFFQDDSREKELINLFNLEPVEGRTNVDAVMRLNDQNIEFELKSTSSGSVTTVRDFGKDHIEKWTNKHWLIGVYINKTIQYCWHGSPSDMEPWIKEKEEYIRIDFELSNNIPKYTKVNDLYKIIGKKSIYSFDDAKTLQKKQYSKEKYFHLMDIENGYSPTRMLEILKDRCKYIIQRGSTLNHSIM